ncbi:MAG: Water stress and hypersensitive response domain-containing protein, partial [Sphaerotilus sp.]|nr:Water stress and hypersensitive response domain-containing protein [Sphaerotilus sp.]
MRHADCLPRFHHARALAALFVLFLASLMLAGCASLAYREPVRINVVGLEPIPGEGMEMRFKVKLRVQNPN